MICKGQMNTLLDSNNDSDDNDDDDNDNDNDDDDDDVITKCQECNYDHIMMLTLIVMTNLPTKEQLQCVMVVQVTLTELRTTHTPKLPTT